MNTFTIELISANCSHALCHADRCLVGGVARARDDYSRPRHAFLSQPLAPRVFCTSDLLRNRTYRLH